MGLGIGDEGLEIGVSGSGILGGEFREIRAWGIP